MKFLKSTFIVLFFSVAFVACKKDQDISSPQPVDESPVPEVKSIQGLWAGKYYGLDKSIPTYFSLVIKGAGKVDIVNPAQQVIGSGAWQLNGKHFTASLVFSSYPEAYSFAGELNDSAHKLEGTWGHASSDNDAGFWDMDKMN